MSETPEMWAERMLASQSYHHPAINPTVLAELAAVKRAAELWRAEALAARIHLEINGLMGTKYGDACTARIAAGLR